ncbi:MAG: hypothetical protein A2Z21_09250 [Candidatus Fraserbacteria bacterium RBG_16_55_9]|uniref:Uncharacterized protein n=1 Tax=Fraserbacteria sp. (strain RBG_16_55_9) TaxID=1817864 RepID=A0A1F5UWU2_FRAXR|nr:MAG: hypothetical protein A2Z21_09250 [Candidatus Fraserbacteria bacterium RBG_16_55_9]
MSPTTEEERAKAEPVDLEPIQDHDLFRDFVEQNWNHIRHLETIRLWTTNTYAFIIGGVLAFASAIPDKVLKVFLLIVLFFIAVLGVLMNLRIKADVEDAFKRLHRLLQERVGLAEQLRFGAPKGLAKHINIHWMFLSFYIGMAVLFVLLLLHELGAVLWFHDLFGVPLPPGT